MPVPTWPLLTGPWWPRMAHECVQHKCSKVSSCNGLTHINSTYYNTIIYIYIIIIITYNYYIILLSYNYFTILYGRHWYPFDQHLLQRSGVEWTGWRFHTLQFSQLIAPSGYAASWTYIPKHRFTNSIPTEYSSDQFRLLVISQSPIYGMIAPFQKST